MLNLWFALYSMSAAALTDFRSVRGSFAGPKKVSAHTVCPGAPPSIYMPLRPVRHCFVLSRTLCLPPIAQKPYGSVVNVNRISLFSNANKRQPIPIHLMLCAWNQKW